ncbi:short chain dehydrogenase [Bordetella pertussis]|nr:short chain dehydrogenase [Bordetella pertussis]
MQHVFITGASSGLGQALARRYAADGARLGLLGRRAQALEALAITTSTRPPQWAMKSCAAACSAARSRTSTA